MTAPATSDPAVVEAARLLAEATASRIPCAPVREALPAGDIRAAYAVQRHGTELAVRAGRTVVGRKIGLTSEAVQRQLGVGQPDFGVLFDDMQVPDGGTADHGRLLQPRIEAELAFVLGRDLSSVELTVESVRAATAYVVPALEIVDSRVAGWDINIVDTVADNASSGLFVLGDRRSPLDGRDLRAVTMTMSRGSEVVSTGSGAACLGDPALAVLWLARTALEHDDPLREGDIVLSGALGPMVDVRAGDQFSADLGALGTVSVAISKESA